MPLRYFVTGTDTGVGKSEVSAALLRRMARAGLEPFAFKPFESGMRSLSRPRDGLALMAAGGDWQPLDTISLYRFHAPMAPAMAAKSERRRTSWRRVLEVFDTFDGRAGVVEGAGGLRVPLDDTHDVIDAIAALALPTVLVARAGLGTINHTTLSLDALAARRLPVAAVVLVCSSPGRDPTLTKNRAELERRFPRCAFLGPVPFRRDARQRAAAFERAVAPLTRG